MSDLAGYFSSVEAKRKLTIILAAIVFLASVFYFSSNLSGHEPELNESQDIAIAHDLFTTWILPMDQSPFYYVLLNGWEHLNQTSYAFIRFPSAVFGGIAVLCVFLLMEAEAGIVGALLAALFLAVNPMVVYYSRDARNYTLMLALASASMLFAYRYVFQTKKLGDFIAFLVVSVLGLHTHLFLLIFTGSLGLLVAPTFMKNRQGYWSHKKLRIVTYVGGLLTAIQVVRIFLVIPFTESRNSMYGGVDFHPLKFLKTVGLDLFLGFAKQPDWAPYLLIPLAALFLFGMISLGRRGWISGLILLIPSLTVSWYLSRDNPVNSRYLIYLLPALVCCIAAALAKLRTVLLWGLPAILFTAMSAVSVDAEYSTNTDWPDAAKYIESIRKPDDVVAVFPAFWDHTFRCVYHGETVPFLYIEDIDRIFARGKRIILVHGPGRYYGHVDAYLKKHAHIEQKFATKVRARIEVLTIKGDLPEKRLPEVRTGPTILLAGDVGSGGYPWQEKEGINAFSRLSTLFRSSDLSLIGYEPHSIPWYRWLITDRRELHSRLPNARVAGDLSSAGIRAALLVGEDAGRPDARSILSSAGITPIPPGPRWDSAKPQIFSVRDIKVGFLHVGQDIFTDRQNASNQEEASPADLEKAVERARSIVGSDGRLVVFFPEEHDYDRLFEREDQLIARRAVDAGADVVVGVGGWAAKEVEEYGNGIIAYSLGTLLRPPFEPSTARNSSGIALRLSLPPGEKVRYEIIPVTFDDSFHVAYARKKSSANLLYEPTDNQSIEHLLDRMREAHVAVQMQGSESLAISNWAESEPEATRGNPIVDQAYRLKEWWIHRYTNTLPFDIGHEGYYYGESLVAVSDACSDEECRRSIRFDPGKRTAIWANFGKIILGDSIQLNWAVGDDLVRDNCKPLPAETLTLTIDGQQVFTRKVNYRVGWNKESIDTTEWAGRSGEVTLRLDTTDQNNFAVDVDPVVIRPIRNEKNS